MIIKNNLIFLIVIIKKMYCGNNRLNSSLLNGTVRLGTRYDCLKKRIMTGLNLPYDPEYSYDYEPIDDTKIYCGNNDQLPENYDIFGNLPACLRKGVGIGKKQKADNGNTYDNGEKNRNIRVNYNLFFFIFILIKFIIDILLIYFKPGFVLKDKKTKKINYTKVILISLISSSILIIIIFFIYKFNLKINV